MKSPGYYIWKDNKKPGESEREIAKIPGSGSIAVKQSDLPAQQKSDELEFSQNLRRLEKH